MPKVGMRMVKSAIAVFLCFMLYLVRGEQGIPFYSAIAAILCMQPEITDSKLKGKSRIISTIIGGIIGMFMLYFFQNYISKQQEFLRFTIISIMIIPLLYIPVALHQPASSYLSCVVFLSITVSHIGDESPFIFGLNRILDTVIGILISILVNSFHLPHKKHTEILIETPLELLLEKNGKLNTYTRVHLNQCLMNGMQLLLTSSKTPNELLSSLSGIHGNILTLLMDGILYFDYDKKECCAMQTIGSDVWTKVYDDLYKENYVPFVYEVRDGLLYVHYNHFQNEQMKQVYLSTHKKEGISYVYHIHRLDKAINNEIVSIACYLTKKEVERIHKILSKFQKEITWVQYPLDENMILLRIYSSQLANENVVLDLCRKRHLSNYYRLSNTKKTSKETVLEIKKVFYNGKS